MVVKLNGSQGGHFASGLEADAHRAMPNSGNPLAASGFDLKALLDARAHEMMDLHEQYINPAVTGVLKTIGFDATYVRGQGAYLFDDRGNRYIDCLGGYAVFACGRNHPVIRAAITQAMHMDLPSLPGVGLFRTAGLLAESLVKIAPGELGKVMFASAGGEAVDIALKMARIATGRTRIVHCARSYHGLTIGSLSVTGNPEFRDGFGPLLADVVEIPFNDLPAIEQALAGNNVAAFIVEPIQGKGVNIPHEAYLKSVADLCTKHGTIFIVDEIQTGMGRTGRWWASEHDGAGTTWQPDIMVIGKAMGGGYCPLSAVLCRDWIHTKVFPGMAQSAKIQNTFSMYDTGMVAALATLHVMRQERIVENARDVGAHLLAGLSAMVGKHEMVKSVRGRGLMIGVEFGRPSSLALKLGWDALHKLDANLFCQAILMPLMSEHKILAQVAGYKLDNIKLIPPLVLSKADADVVISAMNKAVASCHRFPGPAWEVGARLTAAAAKRFVPRQSAAKI